MSHQSQPVIVPCCCWCGGGGVRLYAVHPRILLIHSYLIHLRPNTLLPSLGRGMSPRPSSSNHYLALAEGPLYAAPPAAASASPNGDEHDDEADANDDAVPPNWQAMGMAEPPTPPVKHTTQVDLTGVPARVMNSVFKLKVHTYMQSSGGLNRPI